MTGQWSRSSASARRLLPRARTGPRRISRRHPYEPSRPTKTVAKGGRVRPMVRRRRRVIEPVATKEMRMPESVTLELGGRTFRIEVGKVAAGVGFDVDPVR